MDEKGYRLKYLDKWLKIKRVLGHYEYELYNDYSHIPVSSYNSIVAARSLVCEDNDDLLYDNIEIVEFNEPVKQSHKRKTIKDYL